MNMKISRMIAVGALALLIAGGAQAQMKMVQKTLTIIPELGAAVTDGAAGPVVDRVNPPEARLAAYRNADIQEGDVIVSANGKQMKTAEDLKTLLDEAKPGDNIMLAVKRQSRVLVTSYEVADEGEKAKAMDLLQKHFNSDQGEGGQVQRVLKIGGEGGMSPWLDLSVLLADGDSGIEVAEQVDMPKFVPDDIKLEKGDIIKQLQDKEYSDCASFLEAYDGIAVGKSVRLTVVRGQNMVKLVFDKPDAPKPTIMMHNK